MNKDIRILNAAVSTLKQSGFPQLADELVIVGLHYIDLYNACKAELEYLPSGEYNLKSEPNAISVAKQTRKILSDVEKGVLNDN